MERLMEQAKKVADRVEVYCEDTVLDTVSFENARLKDIDSKMQSGVRLTLLKGGRLGSAYTRNLIDREGLAQNALASLKAGTEADYDLPQGKALPALKTYESSLTTLSNTAMTDECQRICDYLTKRVRGQVNTAAGRTMTKVRVLNSRGTDLSATLSNYMSYGAAFYPGSYSAVARMVAAKEFAQLGEEDLEFIASTYNASQKEAKPRSGPTKVLFLPEAMYALIWRLTAATSAKSFYEKVSPVLGKLGQKLFSEKLSVVNEPLDDSRPGARSFDDEGTACRTLPIVEAGVLKSIYCDWYYAWKLGIEPTGDGFREGIETKAVPTLGHLVIKPGTSSLCDLLGMMGSGVVVSELLGAHSGNILNGDFSVGLAPGLWVEKGEIVGHVKDAMVAGNIYEILKNVVAVGNRLMPAHMGWFPPILFENVNFAAKG
jgi:PmbA protein